VAPGLGLFERQPAFRCCWPLLSLMQYSETRPGSAGANLLVHTSWSALGTKPTSYKGPDLGPRALYVTSRHAQLLRSPAGHAKGSPLARVSADWLARRLFR
jgi:hypothetical protein